MYLLTETSFYSGSYAEGLITLYPEDLMLGVPSLLVYQFDTEMNDTFTFDVEVVEADVIPEAELTILDDLTKIFDSSELVPEQLLDGTEKSSTLIDCRICCAFLRSSYSMVSLQIIFIMFLPFASE